MKLLVRTKPLLVKAAIGLLGSALIASACSAADEDNAREVTNDSTASAVAEEQERVEQDSEAESARVEVTGPTTTFVPDVGTEFSTDGGVDRGNADVELIEDVDAVDSLPPTLSGLAWPTDWSRRTVEDWEEFLAGLGGSDPRDGIPPIDAPVFETVALASQWLAPREPGALVTVNGESRFYPLSILTRHEIVNDAFGDVPVAVTFCPLCNTALAFDRRVDGSTLRFGVSGLLRNSDLVMWDESTTSLWQQITGEAVVGDFAGTQLAVVPTSVVSFSQFAENFPEGRSLAAESAFGRQSYGVNPYVGYSSSQRPFLFNGDIDDQLPALSRVIGVDTDDGARAYPFAEAQELGVINDVIGDTPVVVFAGGETADALDEQVIGISEAIGTALALDPVVDSEVLTFSPGPESGSFTDDQTGSTWTIVGLAIDGPLAGTQLNTVVHRNEFWFAWQAFFGADSVFGS